MATGLPVASRLLGLRDDRRRVLIVAGAGTVACMAFLTTLAESSDHRSDRLLVAAMGVCTPPC